MISRFTFLKSLRLALILTGVYVAVVGITGIDIYKNHITNWWTSSVERIFPYPAAIAARHEIPLSRFRKEVAARKNIAKKNNLKTSDTEIQSTVIDRLVNSTLYAQALKDHNITVTDQDVDTTLDNIYKQIGGKENLTKFLVEDYGAAMSLEDFRTLIREFLIQSAIEKQVLVHASVKHILIALPDNPTDAEVESARQKALEIKTKITNPSKFSEVAKEYSEDVSSRDKGGDLGTSPRGSVAKDFSPEFENLVFSIPVGQVSDPVRSKHGWHLVLVEKREGTIDKSLDQYTEQLRKEGNVSIFIGK